MQWRPLAAILVVLCGTLAASSCEGQQSSSVVVMRPGETVAATQPASQQAQPAADPRFLAADLPLLPIGVDRGVMPLPVVRAAYEFAARHPEVMHYVPCFCGCERGGHKDNHDCFVSGRDAANHVTGWEPHGLVCEICLSVAQQARQMHESGASITEIRAAIEQKYAAISAERGHHTPTPMPKHGGAQH